MDTIHVHLAWRSATSVPRASIFWAAPSPPLRGRCEAFDTLL